MGYESKGFPLGGNENESGNNSAEFSYSSLTSRSRVRVRSGPENSARKSPNRTNPEGAAFLFPACLSGGEVYPHGLQAGLDGIGILFPIR